MTCIICNNEFYSLLSSFFKNVSFSQTDDFNFNQMECKLLADSTSSGLSIVNKLLFEFFAKIVHF